jgi:hypothetical protein
VKRVVLMGDLHCGHGAGLTPPEWMVRKVKSPKLFALECEMWDRYMEIVEKYSPIDMLIVNGDVVDGKGHRSGGSELIEPDMLKQVDMAVDALSPWDTGGYLFTYGTPYHTATESGEDVERLVAEAMGGQIKSHLFVDVDGLVIDCKHKVSSSQIPWGKHTAVSRTRIQNLLWNEMDESQPKAKVFARSHVHYFNFCGGTNWLGMTLPALQAASTKYGARQCEAPVDWGVVILDIEDGKLVSWQPEIVTLSETRQEVIQV